jgi:ATP-binding cassette subfamily F protein 3
MLLNPANLLVLDEPTNHLDIASKAVLKEALGSFAGSFLIVSHDRAFMHGIISHVWEMRGGCLTCHIGGIDGYLQTLSMRDDTAAQSGSPGAGSGGPVEGRASSGRRLNARELRRRAAREREFMKQTLGPLEERVREAETSVQGLEEQKDELESLLADPAVHSDGARMKDLNSRYKYISQQIDKMYILWEKAEEELSVAKEAIKSS